MKNIETEEQVEERLGDFYIPIWPDCDTTVADAIAAFRERWRTYSLASKSNNLIRLIKETIDPAIVNFLAKHPEGYINYMPVRPPSVNYSDLVKSVGFRETVDSIKNWLCWFMELHHYTEQEKQCFIATQEALITFFGYCEDKRPHRPRLTPDAAINTQRPIKHCKFCGNQTEFAAFMAEWKQNPYLEDDLTNDQRDTLRNKKKRPDLSHKYCHEHKAKFHDGTWNPQYKKAKRTAEQFEIELLRLRRQIAHPDKYNARSGDVLIDEYFYYYLKNKAIPPEKATACFNYLRQLFANPIIADNATSERIDAIIDEMTDADTALGPTNIRELRNLARDMVDQRLTDDKKKMLVLRKRGLTQREIAEKLTVIFSKNYTHQGVSRSLAAVSKAFRLDD
ncbi:transcriptional regulator [Motilimonas sp. E26]|uniref:transcriptional regulator n=1 Tax=Motilimonas sp. E26 TaxID=2865674 RepID=UPI001E48AC35|nr:transcriptional regulator [Motilimonas sp. E26]MCE0556703.1 transcriptional regulator [Motilimonas sp. E26]